MNSISVSNLESYRTWLHSEDLDLDWLLRRLRGTEPQTDAMKAGEALHGALEHANLGSDITSLESGAYRFYVQCDGLIELPIIREHKIEKHYGDLLVRGRVDGITGTKITDYKSTSYLEADRLLEGFQWRFYLAMSGCNSFVWKVFTLKEFAKEEYAYEITSVQELTQHRYEGLEGDCERLAADFWEFSKTVAL